MHTKWYMRILIVILALAGIGIDSIAVPNQEIVVQFAQENVAVDDTQDTIAIVKEQLQTLGADNIQVQETTDGKLKITYYSDIDVVSIKKILSKAQKFNVGYALNDNQTGVPSQEDSKRYELDVYEIQSFDDFESDTNGYVLELESKSTRFYAPTIYFSNNEIDIAQRNKIAKVAYKLQRDMALAIEEFEYRIPEVRAGPLT